MSKQDNFEKAISIVKNWIDGVMDPRNYNSSGEYPGHEDYEQLDFALSNIGYGLDDLPKLATEIEERDRIRKAQIESKYTFTVQ